MKGIVITTLLLCMTHLSTQIPRIWGDCRNATQFLEPYVNSCVDIRCDGSRRASITRCTQVAPICGPHRNFVVMRFDDEKEFPDCCVEIICE